MRVVFMGTPDVSVPSLEAVAGSSHEVVAVVTQPDRVRGRGREVSASPVKEAAAARGIPVLQPGSPNEDGFADTLRSLEPASLAVVAYGHILRPHVLDVAPAMNVHFSLLPAYRGAAPVQRALMDGVSRTGVSVFLLEPSVDTGPVLAREAIDVAPEETAGDVLARLAPVGARLLVEALDALEAGRIAPQEQDDALASPAPKIRPEDGAIDWTLPASTIANLVRALNPRPGAHAGFRGKRLGVWRARPMAGTAEPGTVVEAAEDFVVGTGEGMLALNEVQPEGKRRMTGAEFVRGYRPEPGRPLDGN